MNKWQSALIFLTFVYVFIFTVDQALGTQKTTKELATRDVVVKSVSPSTEPSQKPASKPVPS
ncbi:MAG TPA: hypothetical protein VJM08_17945, partial [Anaerolineales bacterium]|nr:hypothetical protein [Anaerolineales bacterium]